MSMVSMKYTPAEAKQETMLAESSEAPQYPYGLSICLDDEILAKLGIDPANLPTVGTVFYIEAKAEVCSTSQYQNQDGANTSLSLQITDMSLSTTDDDAPRSQDSIANRLYGG